MSEGISGRDLMMLERDQKPVTLFEPCKIATYQRVDLYVNIYRQSTELAFYFCVDSCFLLALKKALARWHVIKNGTLARLTRMAHNLAHSYTT